MNRHQSVLSQSMREELDEQSVDVAECLHAGRDPATPQNANCGQHGNGVLLGRRNKNKPSLHHHVVPLPSQLRHSLCLGTKTLPFFVVVV